MLYADVCMKNSRVRGLYFLFAAVRYLTFEALLSEHYCFIFRI